MNNSSLQKCLDNTSFNFCRGQHSDSYNSCQKCWHDSSNTQSDSCGSKQSAWIFFSIYNLEIPRRKQNWSLQKPGEHIRSRFVQQENKLGWNALNKEWDYGSITENCHPPAEYVLEECLWEGIFIKMCSPTILSCEHIFANCLAGFETSFAEISERFVSSPHA